MDIVDKIYNLLNGELGFIYLREFDIEIDEDMWTLVLDINNADVPLRLSYQGDDVGFCKFIKSELKSRGLDRVKHFSGELILPETPN